MEIYTPLKQTNKQKSISPPGASADECLLSPMCLLSAAKGGTLERSVQQGSEHFSNAGGTPCGAQGWFQTVIKFFLPISTEVLSIYRRDVYMFVEICSEPESWYFTENNPSWLLESLSPASWIPGQNERQDPGGWATFAGVSVLWALWKLKPLGAWLCKTLSTRERIVKAGKLPASLLVSSLLWPGHLSPCFPKLVMNQ